MVATVNVIKKFKGKESFFGKVNHVINYEIPSDIEDYKFRVNLMSNSEKVSTLFLIVTVFFDKIV